MNKFLILFVKIMIVLMIFTFVLPYLIDSVINMFIIEDSPNVPKGNSTFVSGSILTKKKTFQQNFYFLTKYYLY